MFFTFREYVVYLGEKDLLSLSNRYLFYSTSQDSNKKQKNFGSLLGKQNTFQKKRLRNKKFEE